MPAIAAKVPQINNLRLFAVAQLYLLQLAPIRVKLGRLGVKADKFRPAKIGDSVLEALGVGNKLKINFHRDWERRTGSTSRYLNHYCSLFSVCLTVSTTRIAMGQIELCSRRSHLNLEARA